MLSFFSLLLLLRRGSKRIFGEPATLFFTLDDVVYTFQLFRFASITTYLVCTVNTSAISSPADIQPDLRGGFVVVVLYFVHYRYVHVQYVLVLVLT